MSRAKELARAIKDFPKSSYVYAVHDDLGVLIDAVLSEPEPELKGWIEIYEQGLPMTININQIEWFGDQRIRLVSGDNPEIRLLRVKESYEELKQLIARAS
jgi:hypothetical protein